MITPKGLRVSWTDPDTGEDKTEYYEEEFFSLAQTRIGKLQLKGIRVVAKRE